MATFFGALVVGVLTGLTYMAYHLPHAYSEIYGFLCLLSTAAIVGLFSWNLAIDITCQKIMDYVELGKRADAQEVGTSHRVSFWIILFFACLLGYWSLLLSLNGLKN